MHMVDSEDKGQRKTYRNAETEFKCLIWVSFLFFGQINLKRARVLVKSHVLHSRVPGKVIFLLNYCL